MLLIAQPRSASTSLMDTIQRASGVKSCQKFNNGKQSYKKIYRAPDGYNFLQHHHSDFRDIPFNHILDRINDPSAVYKQHFPPTNETLKGIRDTGKNVVILLRDPEAGMNSYKKLNVGKYKESLADLKEFNERYRTLSGLQHVFIITYEELIENVSASMTKILNHLSLPVPPDIDKLELSKKRTTPEYYDILKGKKIAFIGPAPTLKGKTLGEKIDGYDLVIRMKQPIVPEALHADYGKRTDIIYCNLDSVGYPGAIRDHYPKWKSGGLKWVCMARRKKSRKKRAIMSGITDFFRFRRVSKSFYRTCKKRCRCRGRNIPFTGTVALMDVLAAQYSELYITGFDFYQSAKKGACGHYDGFNTKQFENKVNYKKYYKTIYSTGNPKYRHNAQNDIKALRKVINNSKKLGKNVVLGDDIKGALGLC